MTTQLVKMLGGNRVSDGSVEIIVVDDGSPTALLPLQGARVLRLDQNRGFGHAVNAGVREARHDVLVVLNSDLRPAPSFLTDLLAAAHREFPALTAPMVTEGGRVMENATTFPTVRWTVWSRSALPFLRARVPGGDPQHRTEQGNREVAWLSGAALCFPRAVFEQAGGFDEAFFMYLEDVDLQDRLRSAGVRRVLLEDVTVEHVGAGSSSAKERRTWMVDSSFVYFAKRHRLASLTAAWSAMIATNALYDLVRRLAGRDVDMRGSAVQQWRLMRSGLSAARRVRAGHSVPS